MPLRSVMTPIFTMPSEIFAVCAWLGEARKAPAQSAPIRVLRCVFMPVSVVSNTQMPLDECGLRIEFGAGHGFDHPAMLDDVVEVCQRLDEAEVLFHQHEGH